MDGSKQKSMAAMMMDGASDELRASLAQGDLFGRLQKTLKTVAIEGQILYVAEGDTLLDEAQLMIYADQRAAADNAARAAAASFAAGLGVTDLLAGSIDGSGPVRGLLGMVQNGRIVRWRPGTALTYCVLKNTFPNSSQYEQIVANMSEATTAWENTCGVQFVHRDALDSSDSMRPAGAIFPVRYLDTGGRFIAAAFFPNDPLNRRFVLIDPSYFTTDFNVVGVLRHELGHVLGFRHEHIRSGAPPLCPDEDPTGTFDLTQYDPRSVMHYFCGGVGSRNLEITDLDRSGAQRVYGPPLSSFAMIDVSPEAAAAFAAGEPEIAPAPGEDASYLQSRVVGQAGFDESYFDQPATPAQFASATERDAGGDTAGDTERDTAGDQEADHER